MAPEHCKNLGGGDDSGGMREIEEKGEENISFWGIEKLERRGRKGELN